MAESLSPDNSSPEVNRSYTLHTGQEGNSYWPFESRLYESSSDVRARFKIYEYAEGWDVRSDVLDFVEECTDIKSAEIILELGCSDASDLVNLRKDRNYQGKLVGVDTNSNLFATGIDTIQREGIEGIELIEGKAEDLPFKDNSIDAVMAWYMLYETNPKQALSEAWRVLKPGGLMLLTTHGEFNIPVHRRIERLISMTSKNRFKPPIIKSRLFTMEIAEELLSQQGFVGIQDFHSYDQITIPPEDKAVYKASLDTRKKEFKPMPTTSQWHKITNEIVDPYIDSEIKTYGYIFDDMDRWGFVYQKPLDGLPIKPFFS